MRAITSIALGATVAVLSAPFLMHLVKSVLHYGCEFLVGGEAGDGSWACSDGIGYVVPGVSLVVPVFLAAVAGTILTLVLRGSRARRIVLGLSAAAPLAWAFIWTLIVALQYVDHHPDSMGVWASAVLPSLLLCLSGVMVLAVTPIRSIQVDRIALGVGLLLFVAGTALQPGLIPVIAVAAGFAVAATRPMTRPSYVLTQ